MEDTLYTNFIKMEEENTLRISKNTQKFVNDVANLPPHKYDKVMGFLETLEKQQNTESHLENKRGWRYMWQRTPKPYLLMLGYLVFLAPVGSFGYQALSHVSQEFHTIYFLILLLILILPLSVVFYLSYNYVKKRIQDE